MNYLQRKKLAFMSIINKVKGFIRSISGVPPLALKDCVDEDSLIDYKIYGDSVQNGTPTPETPVEVQSVGEKTINLFDKDNVNNIFCGYISSKKLYAYSTTSGASKTTYIICKPNTTYTVSRQVLSKRFVVASGIYPPAIDIEFTNQVSNGNALDIQITTGSEDTYLYVWFYNSSIDTEFSYDEVINGLRIEEGSTATEYEPYNKYKVPVVARGKNLLDRNLSQMGYGGNTYIMKNGYSVQGILWSDLYKYSTQANPTWYVTYPIPIKPNTFYTYSGLQKGNNPAFIFLEEDKTTIISGKPIRYYDTFKTPDNARYIVMSIYADYVKTMMLEESETVTDYEPYHEPIQTNLYLDEPLRKVGDYADYVDFKNQKVVRNIISGVLNGSENWIYLTNGRCYYYDTKLNVRCLGNNVSGIISNFLPSKSWNDIRISGIGISTYTNGTSHNRIDIRADGIWTNLEEVKEYLNNNPITYFAPCLESFVEQIQLPKLPTIKGTTIYEIGTTINASNMEATYYSTSKGG